MQLTRIRIFFALCLIGPGSVLSAEEGDKTFELISADDAAIAIMGRVHWASGSAHMGFPGVTIRFSYRGPAPTLRLVAGSADCYFNVSLNGSQPVVMRLAEGANEVALPFAAGPDEGSVVEIVRRTESWMGDAVFQGLTLREGTELLPPPPWPERRLMIVGDSTSCGEFNERFPPNEEVSPRTTNAARSYGMILADMFNAQAHLVAYGGQGILRDWSGKSEGDEVVLVPDYFERSLPRIPTAYWDHSAYVPEVIVINLGTDFDAGPLDEAAYADAYDSFVKQVRTTYPLSFIVLAESSFLSDVPGTDGFQARQVLRKTLEAVVARGRQAGDQRLLMADSRYYPGTPGDPHLTAFQQEKLAEELAGPIRKVTGWR